MARITMKISKTDGTVLDNAAAEFDDTTLGYLIASCEPLKFKDADGNLITGARMVSYATRVYLTGLVRGYIPATAAQQTFDAVLEQVDQKLGSMDIIDNPE